MLSNYTLMFIYILHEKIRGDLSDMSIFDLSSANEMEYLYHVIGSMLLNPPYDPLFRMFWKNCKFRCRVECCLINILLILTSSGEPMLFKVLLTPLSDFANMKHLQNDSITSFQNITNTTHQIRQPSITQSHAHVQPPPLIYSSSSLSYHAVPPLPSNPHPSTSIIAPLSIFYANQPSPYYSLNNPPLQLQLPSPPNFKTVPQQIYPLL
jgi:hypothetical protein